MTIFEAMIGLYSCKPRRIKKDVYNYGHPYGTMGGWESENENILKKIAPLNYILVNFVKTNGHDL